MSHDAWRPTGDLPMQTLGADVARTVLGAPTHGRTRAGSNESVTVVGLDEAPASAEDCQEFFASLFTQPAQATGIAR